MAEGRGLRGRIDTGAQTILSVNGSHGQNTGSLGHTRCSFVAPMHAKIARQTAKAVRSLYDRSIKHRPFPKPKLSLGDRIFYDTSRDELLDHGFTFLGDLREVTAPKGSAVYKTPLRVLVDRKGRIMATVAWLQNTVHERLANELHGMPSGGTIDLETEFSNGRFIMTSNAESAGLMDFPPQIDTRFFRAGTKAGTLLREHRRRVRAYMLAHPKLSIRTVASTEEYGQAQARQGAIKAAFKKKTGYVTTREVKRIAQRGTDAALDIQSVLSDFLGDMCDIFQAQEKGASKKTA